MNPVVASLHCHPDTRSAAARSIEARAFRTADNGLHLTYAVQGDLSRIEIRPARPPHRTERLWEHTCFEAFLCVEGGGYYEFNFAPSGEWAVYAFGGYRQSRPLPDIKAPPKIVWQADDRSLRLEAAACLDSLPGIGVDQPLRLGLAAVIEDERAALSYWALRHAPGKPDFHHAAGFALEIGPANGARRPR